MMGLATHHVPRDFGKGVPDLKTTWETHSTNCTCSGNHHCGKGVERVQSRDHSLLAGFRFLCLTACGFKSRRSHVQKASDLGALWLLPIVCGGHQVRARAELFPRLFPRSTGDNASSGEGTDEGRGSLGSPAARHGGSLLDEPLPVGLGKDEVLSRRCQFDDGIEHVLVDDPWQIGRSMPDHHAAGIRRTSRNPRSNWMVSAAV